MNTQILIIVRGPSCSGKTTVAKKLFTTAKNKTAIIQQDNYRGIFNPPGGGSKYNGEIITQMIEHNTTAALKHGYNVILEGVLNVKLYQDTLDRIIENHTGKTYLFYLDVSLEETIERGKTKSLSTLFTAEQLNDWYPASRTPYHDLETLLPEQFSSDDSFEFILNSLNEHL